MRLKNLIRSVGEEISIGNPDSFDRFSNVVDISLQRGRIMRVIPVITRRVYGGASHLSYFEGKKELLFVEGKKELLFERSFYFPSGNYFSALTDLRMIRRLEKTENGDFGVGV